MIKRVSTALAILLMLSGCSSTKKSNIGSILQNESSLTSDFEKNTGDRVFFAFDKSNLSQESKVVLDKQVDWLKNHSGVKAVIEGHCDERGTREYNLALGEKRADSVKKFLVSKGIESSRLDTISYGKEKPAVIGNSEEFWKQNRRAVTATK